MRIYKPQLALKVPGCGPKVGGRGIQTSYGTAIDRAPARNRPAAATFPSRLETLGRRWMPPTKIRRPDRRLINMDNEAEVRHWTKHLKTSKDDLQSVIEKVGNSAPAVRKELAFRREVSMQG